MQRKSHLKALLSHFKPYLRRKIIEKIGEASDNSQLANAYVNGLFAQDTAVNQLIKTIDAVLVETAGNIRMTKVQIQHFLQHGWLGEDCITAAVNSITAGIHANPALLLDAMKYDSFNLTELISHLREELSENLTARYAQVDDRHVENNSIIVRRMNSLSRLFRFTDGLSVCSAVTVHKGEFILACNSSHNDLHDELIEKARQRLQILHTHILNVMQMGEEKYHENYLEINAVTCKALLDVHLSAFGEALTSVALEKFTDAICFDPDTFSDETKSAFTQAKCQFTMIVPVLDNERNLSLKCAGQPNLMPTGIKSESVTYAHAEQILAFYLMQIRKEKFNAKAPVTIGITKLCCSVCFDCLGHSAAVHGKHGENEITTLRMIDNRKPDAIMAVYPRSSDAQQNVPAVIPPEPTRYVTHPVRSPQNSAVKKREERVFVSSFAKRATLFSKADGVGDGDLPDNNQRSTKQAKRDK